MPRRTRVQLALLALGLVVWGYGQRTDESGMTLVGLAFFAVAFVLRFFTRKEPPATP